MDFYFYISLVLYVSLLAPLNHVTATAPDTLKLVHMVIVLFLLSVWISVNVSLLILLLIVVSSWR